MGYIEEDIAKQVATQIEAYFNNVTETPTIYKVEELVFELLVKENRLEVARAYEGYRSVQSYKREVNTTDESILGLLNRTNHEVLKETQTRMTN